MRKQLTSAILLLMMTIQANAADLINTSFFGNVAIEGYDSVAYFQQNTAVKGDPAFQHDWQGANWHFSSAENKALFVADPEKYAPQYGGYCAYAISQNTTAGIDPSQFTIVNDKLFLNYNAKIQKKWLADRDAYIIAANKNWPDVVE